ncbi:Uncharacterised protein [Shigella sonnei]|nr:Uncharacterised protein [Shigella sonnei]
MFSYVCGRCGSYLSRHWLSADIFRRFKALLNGATKYRCLAIQRQQQGDFVGRGWFKRFYVNQLRWQHFRARIVRITFLPVGDPGFHHVGIVTVIKPDALQIQPALQNIFVGVDHQRIRLFLSHGGERLPGGINILLFFFRAEQRFLSN